MLWVTVANLFLWDTNAQGVQVKRENSLDHWDSDTLAYYLDNYPGYDMAVMFYASWDQNSRALAPYWNQIAHEMDAGSTQSKIIMVSTIIDKSISQFRHTFVLIVPMFVSSSSCCSYG